ncbi:helix-turn-helix domain-containing protein [Deinococcus yunweiensis]|uniref:helix-turn-helix domain-containing protein n=1 Tax=Deinococcus yunweiensis TaxID=367282 RepID=UPI00398F626B
MTTSLPAPSSFGGLLRAWRTRRRLSQEHLAAEALVSTRHLSYLETSKAAPSREMVLRLSEPLGLPLRERNQLLLAAGFAPHYAQRPLDDPALRAAREAIDTVLSGHDPNPALAVDRLWNLHAANPAAQRLMAGVHPDLLAAPVNVLRLSLHPLGLAPHIENYGEWRAHLLARLRREADLSPDGALHDLHRELVAFPAPPGSLRDVPDGAERPPIVIPLRFQTPAGVLNLLSTTTVFGTPLDVTLSELAIESFFPADRATAERLRVLSHGS